MSDLAEAKRAIAAGFIVGVPTDTVYGLAVDPRNAAAVAALYELKRRPALKPVALLVGDLEQAESMGLFSGKARQLAALHWPGPLTLVVRALISLPEWVGDPVASTVGIRVPDHPLTLNLLERTGPLAVTSANLSGRAAALDEEEARSIFGAEVPIYLEGRSYGGEASTVVDATGPSLRVLRKGPIKI